MKIAILADIHGNSLAFKAVLQDLKAQGPIDQLIIAGDFFAPGPDPAGVLALLQQLPNARFLSGNTDRYLLNGSYTRVYGLNGWQGQLRDAFAWTREQLGETGGRFLAALPFCLVANAGERQLMVVHGSPRSDEEGLTVQTSPATLAEMPLPPGIDLLVCGHTHLPMDRQVNGLRVVNAGSVGIPFDGDARAGYALISTGQAPASNGAPLEPASWQVELRRVPYDVGMAIAQFYLAGHPAANVGAFNLRFGRPIGQGYLHYLADRQLEPDPVG